MVTKEKSERVLRAEQKLEEARQMMRKAKRDDAVKRRKMQNHFKYMMGGIVQKYFPECYEFDETELNRILATAIKSEQCESIIKLIRKECREKESPETAKLEIVKHEEQEPEAMEMQNRPDKRLEQSGECPKMAQGFSGYHECGQ